MTNENNISESILLSVKDLLGLEPEIKDFDTSIIININSAIFTLTQLGMDSFQVKDENDKYSDWIHDQNLIYPISQYLFLKTKIIFDSSTLNTIVIEQMKEAIKELECRINYELES